MVASRKYKLNQPRKIPTTRERRAAVAALETSQKPDRKVKHKKAGKPYSRKHAGLPPAPYRGLVCPLRRPHRVREHERSQEQGARRSVGAGDPKNETSRSQCAAPGASVSISTARRGWAGYWKAPLNIPPAVAGSSCRVCPRQRPRLPCLAWVFVAREDDL